MIIPFCREKFINFVDNNNDGTRGSLYFCKLQHKKYIMVLSESGERLRQLINKAIDDHIITPEEYDEIIQLTMEDGHIDSQEQALLSELQKMIENKDIRFARGE